MKAKVLPRDLGFKMPPEWFEHQRTFIAWPVKDSVVWPENYEATCRAFAETARACAEFEPVTMVVNGDTKERATELCGSMVDILEIEHNDSWMRDNGPTFVINDKHELAGIDWDFNAWGGKYEPWDLDDEVAAKVLKHFEVPGFEAPFVLEGGSIHVDGQGTLLTTEECLLNPNRNPKLSRAELEALLQQYLDVQKIIWLPRGLDGDETDGHVDNIACFARPGAVIIQTCDDPQDPNYEITQRSLEILRNTIDARGRQLEIIELPQPKATYYNGVRLTLSYLNFYFVNNGIILPVFGGEHQESDQKAEAILKEVYPDRTIKAVDGLTLVREGGNVHCITQQMPKGLPARIL